MTPVPLSSSNWSDTTTGHGGDARKITSGSSSDTATWTVAGLTEKQQYEVFVTWDDDAANATDASYTVSHGSVTESSVEVDQQVDLTSDLDAQQFGSTYWRSLGVYTVTDDSLDVELSGEGDGTVVADAVYVLAARPATEYQYDAANRLEKLIDVLGRETKFEYDDVNRLTKETYPDPNTGLPTVNSPIMTYSYDAVGNQRKMVDALGNETEYVYDKLYRLINQIDEDPNDSSVVTMDDEDPGFTTTGTWTESTASGNEGDHYWHASGSGSNKAEFKFTGLAAGYYQVSATWVKHSNRATDSPFTILDDTMSIVTVDVNQELAPNPDAVEQGTRFQDLGEAVPIASGTLVVRLTDDANQYVVADAVRIERVDLPPEGMEVIEDENAGYTATSGWAELTGAGVDDDYQYIAAGSGSEKTEYTFTGLAPGYYQVSATWPEHSNRATDSPFTILDDTTAIVTVDVNQELAPMADVIASGDAYQHIGEPVEIGSGKLVVRITDDANQYVIADAALIQRVDPPDDGVEVIDDDGTGFTQTAGWTDNGNFGFNGTHDYASSGSGSEVATYTFTGLTPGFYQVSATWPENSNRATDTPFIISDDNVELYATTVNQELEPDADAVHDGKNFQQLGDPVPISSGTLVVEITNNANEYVVADAIRIERIESSPVTIYSYDDAGQLLSRTGPLGRTWSYEYDGVGRMVREIYPDPATGLQGNDSPEMVYVFDAAHNVIAESDALDNTQRYVYDNLYRLVTQTDENGDDTTYEYDLVGNLTKLTDPLLNATAWTFDELNRVIEEKNQLNDKRLFEYDLVGNLVKRTDRDDRETEFEYDGLYRQIEERWLDSQQQVSHTISFQYDVTGRMLSAGDSNATYTYAYDHRDRATTITHALDALTPDVTFNQTFDLMNNRTQVTAAIGSTDDFVTDYSYDNLYRLVTIQQQGQTGGNTVADKRVDLVFNIASQIQGVNRYANLDQSDQVAQSDFTFDQIGRLTDLIHRQGVSELASYGWEFDQDNRVTKFTSSQDGSVDYTYDARDQVTDADYTGYGTDEDYTYDENGNRESASGSTYTTGDVNRLEDDGTYSYAYDKEGNRTSRIHNTTDETTVYEWDHRNRLTKITTYSDSTLTTKTKEVTQTYDVFNRWIGREVDSDGNGTIDAETYFVYDGDQIVLQFDGSEATDLEHRYLWGPVIDQILADENLTDDEVYWPLTDNLGTVRDLAEYDAATDTTTIVDHYVYDAFGNETDHTGSNDFLFKYTGRAFDEATGLQNNLNRWYDASVGRWLSEDPIGFSVGDANVYRYVGNNSVNLTDPSGLQPPQGEAPSGATYSELDAPQLPELSKNQQNQARKYGAQKRVTIRVYVTDYFDGDWSGALSKTAQFYQRYNIHINWQVYQIKTPLKKVFGEETCTRLGPGHSVLGTYQRQTITYEDHPYTEYCRSLYVNDGENSANDNPDVFWYQKNFAKNVPTVFFVDDIDLANTTFPGTDAYGLNIDDFVWIADSTFGPEYHKTLAQEIGHLLGADPFDRSASGVMDNYATPNLDRGFTDPTDVDRIRSSRHLR